MAANVKYFRLASRIKDGKGQVTQTGGPVGKQKNINTLSDRSNLLFNFNQDFVENLNSITTQEMGKSVPYIRLDAVDNSGAVLQSYNLDFFHKTIEHDKIGAQGTRNPERPTMSAKDLQIKTDQRFGLSLF